MKAKQKMIGVALLALLLIATVFVASQFFDNGGKTFATQSRSVGLKESSGPGLFSLVGGNNCNSYFGTGDCWMEKETYSYGDATARASARMSVITPFDAPPAYYDNGVAVYVGDQTFQWACTPGDEAYIRVSPTGNLNWYSCDEYGCTGTEQPNWKGTYVVTAPALSVPKIMFQCWDYDRDDNNGWWSYAWVWSGISYPKSDKIRLVTSIPDTDGDGVLDNVDACKDTDKLYVVDATGCPIDTDKDSVFDGKDACPSTPPSTPVDVNGCPLDDDKDGVNNNIDKCPATPVGIAIDNEGCPMDGDKDGVFDTNDDCKETPTGYAVNARGCTLDDDGDGVANTIDACPVTPADATVDDKGCEIPIVNDPTDTTEELGFFAKLWASIKAFFAGLFQ